MRNRAVPQAARVPRRGDHQGKGLAPVESAGLSGYRIATYRPVDQWRAAIAELPEQEREPVREYLIWVIASRKERAELQRRVDAGIDAVLTFKAGGIMEKRWA